MQDMNPYAPPPLVAELVDPFADRRGQDTLWRQDNLLVMGVRSVLPAICVKSNEPSAGFLRRKLFWMPPWTIVLLFLASPIIYLIVALVLQKKATIQIGLSEQWFSIRRQRILIAWLTVAFSVVLFIVGAALVDNYPYMGIAMGLSPVVFLIGLFYGLFAARLVYPKKIDDHYLWLKGVCPEFLAKLPEWPGPRA